MRGFFNAMKRIFLSLATLIIALTISALATSAAWTDTVTIGNNVIQTGTADLLISTDNCIPNIVNELAVCGGGTFSDGPIDSDYVVTDLIPGQTKSIYSFSVQNNSIGNFQFLLSGRITPLATIVDNAPPVDRTRLRLQLYDVETGDDISGNLSLAQWEAASWSIPPYLLPGETINYGIRASLSSSADDNWQDQTVTFSFQVVGQQL